MPSFKFEGFTTGSAVSISATQCSNSDAASVSTWNEADTSSLTVALNATRTSGVAPFGTLYSADSTLPRNLLAASHNVS